MNVEDEGRLVRLERTVASLEKLVLALQSKVAKLSRELENTTEITLPKKR